MINRYNVLQHCKIVDHLHSFVLQTTKQRYCNALLMLTVNPQKQNAILAVTSRF